MLSTEDRWGSRLLLWALKNRCLTTSLPPRLSPRSLEQARTGGLRVPLEPPVHVTSPENLAPFKSREEKSEKEAKKKEAEEKKKEKEKEREAKKKEKEEQTQEKRREREERKTQKEAAVAAKKAERAAKKADEEAKKVEKSKKTKEMKVDDPIPGPSNTRKSARSRK